MRPYQVTKTLLEVVQWLAGIGVLGCFAALLRLQQVEALLIFGPAIVGLVALAVLASLGAAVCDIAAATQEQLQSTRQLEKMVSDYVFKQLRNAQH